MKNQIFKVIGYESFNDLISSVLSLKLKFGMLYVYGMVGSVLIWLYTVIDTGINNYVYSPSKAVWILAFASIGDFILGFSNSVFKKSEGVSWSRMNRAGIRFIVMLWFIGITYQMHLVFPVIIQKIFIEGLFIVFLLSIVYSSLENARDLDFITKSQFNLIDSFVNPKKFINRFFKKQEKEE